jgi:hypothetical protein
MQGANEQACADTLRKGDYAANDKLFLPQDDGDQS